MQMSDYPGEVVGIQQEPEEDHTQQCSKEEKTGKHGLNHKKAITLCNGVRKLLAVECDAIVREGIKVIGIGNITSLESMNKADD
jgi:hypothetical protein